MPTPTPPRRVPFRTWRGRVGGGHVGTAGRVRLAPGPMPAWPRPLDDVAEAWWRLPPRLRTVSVVAILAIVGWGIVARASASPYGPAVQVVVAARDATAGQPITATVDRRPRALVPDGALDSVPTGRFARDIGRGEVLTRRHVARDLADLLGSDEVALALPGDLPALPPHARLEVLATSFDGAGASLGQARLLVMEDDWTWVAMPRAMAADVAAASAAGRVTLAVAPP